MSEKTHNQTDLVIPKQMAWDRTKILKTGKI